MSLCLFTGKAPNPMVSRLISQIQWPYFVDVPWCTPFSQRFSFKLGPAQAVSPGFINDENRQQHHWNGSSNRKQTRIEPPPQNKQLKVATPIFLLVCVAVYGPMTSETGHVTLRFSIHPVGPQKPIWVMGNSPLLQWLPKSDSDQSFGLFGSDVFVHILFFLLLVLVGIKIPGLLIAFFKAIRVVSIHQTQLDTFFRAFILQFLASRKTKQSLISWLATA